MLKIFKKCFVLCILQQNITGKLFYQPTARRLHRNSLENKATASVSGVPVAIGCNFWYDEQKVGEVVDMMNTGSCDLFVVKYKNKEVLFPFLSEYIENIEISDKKIIINQFDSFFN